MGVPRGGSDTIYKGDLEHEVDQVREPETTRQKAIMFVNAIDMI